MQTAEELLNLTQAEYIADIYACPSVEIQYAPVVGAVITGLRVLKDKQKINQKAEKDARKDIVIFSSVNLLVEPTNNDAILYDGKTFKLLEWQKVDGLYIIHAISSSRSSVNSGRV